MNRPSALASPSSGSRSQREPSFLLRAYRHVVRDDHLTRGEGFRDLLRAPPHELGELFDGGLAAGGGLQAVAGAGYGPLPVGGVDGDPDEGGLVGDGAAYGLLDPPRGVGGELGAEVGVEVAGGAHEPEVAFLDEVGELEAVLAHVAAGDGDDEPQVAPDEFLPGRLVPFPYPTGELRLLFSTQDAMLSCPHQVRLGDVQLPTFVFARSTPLRPRDLQGGEIVYTNPDSVRIAVYKYGIYGNHYSCGSEADGLHNVK